MKKTATLAVAAGSLAMVMTGCGGSNGSDSDYQVKGTVDQQWIDYDCHKASGALNVKPVAYVARTSSGTSGGKSTKKNSDSDDTNSSDSSSGGSEPKPKSRTPEKTKASTPAPLKVTKVPSGKPKKPRGYDAKWCSSEYELFIKNNDGVFDQDVTKAVWDACSRKEKFPSCAK